MKSRPLRPRAWWRHGLATGILLLTLLAQVALARVRGPEWVVVPLGLCFLGCVGYRVFKHRLFIGIEVVLVLGYFILIKIFHTLVQPGDAPAHPMHGLDIIGLIILYPAQMALWTGKRTLQELMLLGMVAISQFMYGMTLARPPSWALVYLFFPVLIYSLLQYSTAREIELIKIRPPCPRAHWFRLGGLTLVLLPVMLALGGTIFYLIPRFSTLTRAFELLDEKPDEEEAPGSPVRREEGGSTSHRTGSSQEMDLLVAGEIKRDSTEILVARLRLEGYGTELTGAYAGRLYLRSFVLDDYQERGWRSSGTHYPRVHRMGPEGWVDLPGPASRKGCGFRIDVLPLSRMGRTFVVSPGRPIRVLENRRIRGHPEEWLRFVLRKRLNRKYIVQGEMIYAWEQVVAALKRAGLDADHPDLEHYTRIPDRPRSGEVAGLARRWTAGAEDDVDRISALLRHLRSHPFRYTLDVPEVHDPRNPTADFLIRSRTGHCERFADGLAALCRHLKIPCRVINGYMHGEWRETPTPGFVFRARDAHAWVEVHFSGLGWIAVDPSPHGSLANLGIKPPLDELLGSQRGDAALSALTLGPDAYSAEEQLGLYQSLITLFGSLNWSLVYRICLGLGGFVILIFFLRHMFSGERKDGNGVELIQSGPRFNPILEFYKAARRCGIRPGRGETPLELARRAEKVLKVDVAQVMERLYAVRFGNVAFTPEERAAFDAWLDSLHGAGKM